MKLRNALTALLLAACLGASARAATEADKLHEAEQDMTNRDNFAGAAAIYEELLKDAPWDARLLYNLGNAYALNRNEGMAVWAYLGSLRLAPRDEDLRHNLALLSPDYMERLSVTPLPPVDWLLFHFTANEWAALAGGATTLALLLALAAYKPGRGKKWGRACATTARGAAAVALFAWPFALMHFHERENVTMGVIVQAETYARMGPSARQNPSFAMPAGAIVRVAATTDPEWVRVTYGGGNIGFVERGRVRYL